MGFKENKKLIKALGGRWKKPKLLKDYLKSKYYNRSRYITKKNELIVEFLSEYMSGGSKVIDISCANGVFLEVMRYYGNEILGTDVNYFPFLQSQNIPYQFLDCVEFPYALEDNSFDLISCLGSITFYRPFTIWTGVMNEFARIAKKTIFISVNVGIPFDEFGHLLDNWKYKGWKRVLKREFYYKWEKE